MSLSAAELARLETLEQTVRQLAQLVEGSGSKNQLNRLLVLAQENTRTLTTLVESLEAKMDILIPLAQKLQ
jgi:hypothetical protein